MFLHGLEGRLRAAPLNGDKNLPMVLEHLLQGLAVHIHMGETLLDADKEKIIKIAHQVDEHRILGGEGHRHMKGGIGDGADAIAVGELLGHLLKAVADGAQIGLGRS